MTGFSGDACDDALAHEIDDDGSPEKGFEELAPHAAESAIQGMDSGVLESVESKMPCSVSISSRRLALYWDALIMAAELSAQLFLSVLAVLP